METLKIFSVQLEGLESGRYARAGTIDSQVPGDQGVRPDNSHTDDCLFLSAFWLTFLLLQRSQTRSVDDLRRSSNLSLATSHVANMADRVRGACSATDDR